jgi:hypothetical protein
MHMHGDITLCSVLRDAGVTPVEAAEMRDGETRGMNFANCLLSLSECLMLFASQYFRIRQRHQSFLFLLA